MLVWVSRQASLHSSPQYRVGALHLDVEKWSRASESASDVPSCERYAAKLTDMVMWSRQPRAQTSRQGHQCRKIWPQGSFNFKSVHWVLAAQGFELMSSSNLQRRWTFIRLLQVKKERWQSKKVYSAIGNRYRIFSLHICPSLPMNQFLGSLKVLSSETDQAKSRLIP